MTVWLAAAAAAGVVLVARGRRSERLSRLSGDPATAGRGRRPGWWLLGFAGGTALAGLQFGAGGLAVVVIGGLLLARGRRRRQAARTAEQASAAVVDVVFALAGELRAGRSSAEALTAAVDIAGPLRPALAAAGSAAAAGDSAADVLRTAGSVPGAERMRDVAAAWRVTESAGAPIAVVLERLGASLEDAAAVRAALDAAMAGPRATVALLGGLPLLGVGLGEAMGAHPVDLLARTPLGWALLGVAAGLDAIGVALTRWIARRALGP
ncbi:MAG TPA: type II secretion system F family protein [Mycobacteriales bacterium]|nr:type II secretion system F family protein [Mycobacteriales bacterium]